MPTRIPTLIVKNNRILLVQELIYLSSNLSTACHGTNHQIRAHLASIGHPIVGDGKYGDLRTNERFRKEVHVRSQLLHAYRIVLEDGREVIAPSGREFEDAWDYIQTSAF